MGPLHSYDTHPALTWVTCYPLVVAIFKLAEKYPWPHQSPSSWAKGINSGVDFLLLPLRDQSSGQNNGAPPSKRHLEKEQQG